MRKCREMCKFRAIAFILVCKTYSIIHKDKHGTLKKKKFGEGAGIRYGVAGAKFEVTGKTVLKVQQI